jgi:translocation and assembly module TamA
VATYAISLGQPVRFTAFDLQLSGAAREDEAFAQAKAEFPLAIGDVLVHARWEDGKRSFERLLADRGYFDAQITKAEVRVNQRNFTARGVLTIDSGPRYGFGKVLWPKTKLATRFLQRYVSITPGEPFNAKQMLDFQSRLAESAYFGSVLVEPRRDLAEGEQVPVEVALEMRPAQRYSVGAGFGTDTGVRARASWLQPWVNQWGHRAEADARLSPVQSSLSALYSMPSAKSWTDSVDLTAQLLNEDTDVKKSLKASAGVARLSTRWGWRETLSLEYQVESYNVANESQIARTLVPSARWTRTWSDDPIYARNGLRLSFGIRGADAALLSSTTFLQIRTDAKYVRAFGDTRMIMRGEFGAVASHDFAKLPASERFFAGGDNSLRGFDYESLGPRNAEGKVEGGRFLMLGTLELERKVVGNWSGAVFSDFGNALNDLSDPIAYCVGLGVRWLSPVGLVRLDVANGISNPDFPWRIHVVVGPDL